MQGFPLYIKERYFCFCFKHLSYSLHFRPHNFIYPSPLSWTSVVVVLGGLQNCQPVIQYDYCILAVASFHSLHFLSLIRTFGHASQFSDTPSLTLHEKPTQPNSLLSEKWGFTSCTFSSKHIII